MKSMTITISVDGRTIGMIPTGGSSRPKSAIEATIRKLVGR